MKLKKGVALVVFLLAISMLLVSCDEGEEMSFREIFDKVIDFGNLDFLLGPDFEPIVGFMRIIIVILVFALLFEAARLLPISNNIRIVVALLLAIISGIFMPGTILVAIGAAYSTIVAFVLIGIPVIGGLYAVMKIPSDSTGKIFIKMCIIALLLWVLIAIKNHAKELIFL